MNHDASESDTPKQSTSGSTREYVTFYIDEQAFGIAVDDIREVFHPRAITRVPLAPPEIRGVLNLRGRIVTAIEVRSRLNLPPLEDDNASMMAIGIEVENEAFGLIIDRVGDVLQLSERNCEALPCNMDPIWQQVSSGVYRLEEQLLIILDIQRLLAVETKTEMAA
ncbi:Positive regulator of CheA protein activity (CheW) [hydrothermal vent metagenome]|uniref:Positive regulator of CheA protein activity (CheW) n=1 Tax=hydrothermal vent metagenome TaxID=652676 RepID=A0A3B0RLM7_9ZZZZ